MRLDILILCDDLAKSNQLIITENENSFESKPHIFFYSFFAIGSAICHLAYEVCLSGGLILSRY